jgi:hypothetical protein
MTENNESMMYAKPALLKTLKEGQAANALFLANLAKHNQPIAQKAVDQLIDYVAQPDRKPYAPFTTSDGKEKLHILKDVRKTIFSDKQWKDQISAVEMSSSDSISHASLKHKGMVLSVPVFNPAHTDFVRPAYIVDVSLRFIAS